MWSHDPKLVLLSLDGVRWDEFFDRQIFKNFWKKLAPLGRVYGEDKKGHPFIASNGSLSSLPGYQSIFTGWDHPTDSKCGANDCGRVTTETFLEKIRRERCLEIEQVAVFSSWAKVALAVEKEQGTLSVECGPQGKENLPPWPECRWDQETLDSAIQYLQEKHPPILYIALGDSDDSAHTGNWSAYVEALKRYDRWIPALFETLGELEAYRHQTLFLVTTDHGRGKEDWTEHSQADPYAKYIWLYGTWVGQPKRTFPELHSHLDIRPLIEQSFGLGG